MIASVDTRFLKPWQFYVLILVGALLGHFYAVTMIIDPDVGQLLNKARVLVEQGEVVHYGNRSSGMGSVMGPMTSLVAGLPMLIYNDKIAPLILIQVLHLLALLMLLDVVFREFGAKAAAWTLVLFWLNPWRVGEVFLWNPAYLIFTSSLHLWSAYKLSQKRSFWFSFLNALAIMISMQLHNSFVVLVFVSLMLVYWRRIKVHWLGVLAGVGLGLASLVPFFLLVSEQPDLLVGNRNPKAFLFRGLIYVFPTIKGMVYWLRFNSGFFPKDLFNGLDFAVWMGAGGLAEASRIIWNILKHVVAVGTILVVARINYDFFKPRLQQFKFWVRDRDVHQVFGLDYAMAAFVSLVLVSMLSPIDYNYWHVLILFPASTLPLLDRLQNNWNWKVSPILVYWCLAGYLIFCNLIMAAGSTRHSIAEWLQ